MCPTFEQMETDGLEEAALSGLSVTEGEQCKFSLNSFKKISVVRSTDYLYRNEALAKAAKVCDDSVHCEYIVGVFFFLSLPMPLLHLTWSLIPC